jgi:hypothetical protein
LIDDNRGFGVILANRDNPKIGQSNSDQSLWFYGEVEDFPWFLYIHVHTYLALQVVAADGDDHELW